MDHKPSEEHNSNCDGQLLDLIGHPTEEHSKDIEHIDSPPHQRIM